MIYGSNEAQCRDWWARLESTETPELADLAFFERPEHPWQVMLVSSLDPPSVLGACPVIGMVAERTLEAYLALGWSLKGYRRMPLPPDLENTP